MDADEELTEAGQLFTPFHCRFPGCVGSYVDDAQLANHYSIMHTDSIKLLDSKDPDSIKTEPNFVRRVPVARTKFSCPSKSCGFAADLFSEVSAHHRQAHWRSISPRVRQQMMWKSRLPNMSPICKGMPGVGEGKILAPGLEISDVVLSGDVSVCANDADGNQSSKRVLYSCLSLDDRCSWTTPDWDELLLHMEKMHNCVVESVACEATKTLKQEPRE